MPYTETIYQELIRRFADPSLARTTDAFGARPVRVGLLRVDRLARSSTRTATGRPSTNLSISVAANQADYYISGRFYDMDGIYQVGNDSYKNTTCAPRERLKCVRGQRLTTTTCRSVIDAYEPKHQKNNSQIPRLINHRYAAFAGEEPRRYVGRPRQPNSGYAAFSEGTFAGARTTMSNCATSSTEIDW